MPRPPARWLAALALAAQAVVMTSCSSFHSLDGFQVRGVEVEPAELGPASIEVTVWNLVSTYGDLSGRGFSLGAPHAPYEETGHLEVSLPVNTRTWDVGILLPFIPVFGLGNDILDDPLDVGIFGCPGFESTSEPVTLVPLGGRLELEGGASVLEPVAFFEQDGRFALAGDLPTWTPGGTQLPSESAGGVYRFGRTLNELGELEPAEAVLVLDVQVPGEGPAEVRIHLRRRSKTSCIIY